MTTSPPTANLFMLSAPSGAGKTTLLDALLKDMPQLTLSISYTTRKKRPREKEGEDYYFVSDAAFEDLQQTGGFLEHAKVFNHQYGTPKAEIEQQLAQGNDVMLEIDWQGAQQVRQLMPDSTSIFLLPPSLETLAARLTKRNQDNPDVIAARMAKARAEIAHYNEYDFLVVNDNFDQALADLKAIIISKRLSRPLQTQKYTALLANLLAK